MQQPIPVTGQPDNPSVEDSAPTKRPWRRYEGPPGTYQSWYYQQNKERKREYLARWRVENSEHDRARNRRKGLTWRFRQKVQVFQMISGQAIPACAECGEQDTRVLSVNHLNGDGRHDVKAFQKFYMAIISGERKTDDLNVLCYNCNIRYEFTLGRRALPETWAEMLQEMARDFDGQA